MFTGIIEKIGVLTQRKIRGEGAFFSVQCRFEAEPYVLGESIAVDGICVTIEDFKGDVFSFTASVETLSRTTIGSKRIGEKLHLERALALGGRLGGHLVQGHIDGIGEIHSCVKSQAGAELSVIIPESLQKYVVQKGSLAVQGVSLTVAKFEGGIATISLIPATLKSTYLGGLTSGDQVNLEVDILAKYAESFLTKRDQEIDHNKLTQWGFE